jgi:hypothetical protein
MSKVRTLIFAKAPVPGQVKTRIARAIGAEAAASLYRKLMVHCLETALAAQLGEVVLCVTPEGTRDAFLLDLARRHGLRVVPQQGDDVGARMAHALHWSVSGGTPTLLIGSDCAALTAAYLRDAAAALAPPADVVLGPAEDGGYFLVGVRAACPDCFKAIEWSTPRVLQQTRARLQSAGLRWHELAPTWDVDEPADLPRLRQLAACSAWGELPPHALP